MSQDVKIEKIVVEIDDNKISLTPAQAKELRQILNEMYGEPVTERIIEREREYVPWFRRPHPYLWWGKEYNATERTATFSLSAV